MDRRDFFDWRRLAHGAIKVLGVEEKLQALAQDVTGEAVLVRFARQAMATQFEVILPFGTPQSNQAAMAGLDEIDRLESQLTVYRDDSEVSLMNTNAARVPVVVEKNLYDLLGFCRFLHEQTEGAFDIAVGKLIRAWGFYRRQGRVPTGDELTQARDESGVRHIELSEGQVFYRSPVEVNFGAVGKGYALDRLVSLLRRDFGVQTVLVHGGQSSVLAMGSEPGRRGGWRVAVQDPEDPSVTLGTFHLRNRGLGVSARTYQSFEHEGKRLGHLLDPRTGWPAEGVAGVSVTAPSAAEADALATACFILGEEKTRAYVETHPQVGVVLVPDETPRRVVVLGRAKDEFRPAE